MRTALTLLLLFLLSCQSSKPLNHAITSQRTQITDHWSRIGSCLFHTNGDWIEFDSIYHITHTPDGIRIIGTHPVYRGHDAPTDSCADLTFRQRAGRRISRHPKE